MKDLMRELEEYCCVSSDFSEAGLRKIIERHGFHFDYIPHEYMIAGELAYYAFFHQACIKKRVTEEILRCLLEYFPGAANTRSTSSGETPLHMICYNKNATIGMVKLLIDAAPKSVQIEDFDD